MSSNLISVSDATKITLAPSNADINQGDNVSLQCHASHDPTMDLSFTWTLNSVQLDLEDSAGPYRRVEGVSMRVHVCGHVCVVTCVWSHVYVHVLVVLQKENIGDLMIMKAQLSQAGVYTCTAQTVVDSASAAAKLVIRGQTRVTLWYDTMCLNHTDSGVTVAQMEQSHLCNSRTRVTVAHVDAGVTGRSCHIPHICLQDPLDHLEGYW